MCEKLVHEDYCDCYDCVESRLGRRGGVKRCYGGSGDAAADAVGNWKEAFLQAYGEVQVDILKQKIKASMGKTMEKVADITLASMLAEVRDSQKRAKAEKAAKEKFEKMVKDAGGA